MRPIVSFVVPAYNASSTLSACLSSVADQTDSRYEVIVIDDGSTDDTAAIARRILPSSIAHTVYCQDNKGVSSARNAGIGIAQGEFVCFVDADDLVSPHYVELVAKHAHYNTAIIYFDLQTEPSSFGNEVEANSAVELSWEVVFARALNMLAADKRPSLRVASPWAKAYKAEYLRESKIGFPVNVKVNEDVVFNLDLLTWLFKQEERPALLYVDVPVYFVSNNPSSVTRCYVPDDVERRLIAARTFYESAQFASRLSSDCMGRMYSRLFAYVEGMLRQRTSNPGNSNSYQARKAEFMRFCESEPINLAFSDWKPLGMRPTVKVIHWSVNHGLFAPIALWGWVYEWLSAAKRKIHGFLH